MSEALRVLADITASQWGMVTAAQAGAAGVTRLALSRLAESGHLERIAHGVYRDSGAPSDEFEDLRAAWLSTEPKLPAEARLGDLAGGVVVASSSAALLHGVGDLWANRHEFVSLRRRQTQRTGIRFRQRHLADHDVALVEGLPAMTLERTLADLLEDVGDMSLVADALGTAARKRPLDLDRLRELLSPLAERNGFRRHDGDAVLARLLEITGLDLESVALELSTDPELSGRIIDWRLRAVMESIEAPALTRLTQEIQRLIPNVGADVAQKMMEAIRPLLEEVVRSRLTELSSLNPGKTLTDTLSASTLGHFTELRNKNLNQLGDDGVPMGATGQDREGEK